MVVEPEILDVDDALPLLTATEYAALSPLVLCIKYTDFYPEAQSARESLNHFQFLAKAREHGTEFINHLFGAIYQVREMVVELVMWDVSPVIVYRHAT